MNSTLIFLAIAVFTLVAFVPINIWNTSVNQDNVCSAGTEYTATSQNISSSIRPIRTTMVTPVPTKLVMLTFGDTLKGQVTTAKPILDKYGFKASFFITCDWVGLQKSKSPRLTWQDISLLQKDGQDIESKTMTHRDMSHLSAPDLNFEVARSKKCLSDHSINRNATIFATPHGDEWKNATIINEISKYYNLADNGFARLMFLNCDGYKNQSSQTDCRTYFDNGTLTFANRYSIREWSHNAVDKKYNYNDSLIFQKFVQELTVKKCTIKMVQ